ncbi:hypothetical protein UlMin_032518 [Ulmus minor]
MASTSTQSSSSSSSIGSGQSSAMAPIPSYQMLNHTLPVKLDRTNYILWRFQIDNVAFANGFEDYIDGTSVCPDKELSPGVINPTFVTWRRQDRTILNWIYSSLTPGIMAQIIGHTSSYSAWVALEQKLVSEQDQVINLLGGLGSDYNNVVIAINIRDDKISLEAIHSMLLAFEHRLEQQSSIEKLSTMSANYASSSNNKGGGRKFNVGRGQSYTPNNSNHNYRGHGRGGQTPFDSEFGESNQYNTIHWNRLEFSN